MLTLADLRRVFKALKALLRFDATGIELLDHSPAGFWKSFWVAVLTAPAYAAVTLVHLAYNVTASPERYILIQAGAVAVSLMTVPLLMIPLAKHFERRHRYTRYIVAYNWFQLVEVAFLLPMMLSAEANVLPKDAITIWFLAAQSVIAVYEWYIIRSALGVETSTAAALALVNFLLMMVITQGAQLLM